MNGVISLSRRYTNWTGLYLARGWILWFIRNHFKRTGSFVLWSGLFAVLLLMSYQSGNTTAKQSPKQVQAAKVTTISPTMVPPPAPVAQMATATASATLSAPRVAGFSYVRQSGNTYAYGNCTYYVANRRSIPNNWGNARSWYYRAAAAGFATGSVPRVGAIAWTSAGYFGHVALVEAVSGTSVEISEMNAVAWNRVDTRWASASSFLYIY